MPPASMSKLMTLELLFQRIKDGRVKLTDTFLVSERAWRERSGSTMFVNIGDRISAENLIRGIITQSGNDACIVVAEALGGLVDRGPALGHSPSRGSRRLSVDGGNLVPLADDLGQSRHGEGRRSHEDDAHEAE